jgi:hypothetical protein
LARRLFYDLPPESTFTYLSKSLDALLPL